MESKNPVLVLIGSALGFNNYPNLSGRWEAEYESSYNSDPKTGKYKTFGSGVATIKQSYSLITLDIDWGHLSESGSFFTSLKQKENGEWMLIAVYTNFTRDPVLANSRHGGQHTGFCYFIVGAEGDELSGYYSNNENRKTRGKIKLKKVR